MHQAISREIRINLETPFTLQEIDRVVSSLLLNVAAQVNVRGIIPGHIKELDLL